MFIEGKNPVKEILNSNLTIEKICVTESNDFAIKEIIKAAKNKGARIEQLNKQALDRMSKTGHHQGVIAVVTEFVYSELDQVISDAQNQDQRMMFIVLDKLSDPHNLGSIIRTAECVNATAIILPARNSVLVNETVIRTSAGATSHVKVCKVNNINDAINKLKGQNIFVFSADMDGTSMYKTDLTGNIALVIGAEGNGVSALTKKISDGVVSIPMQGKINSLNASVSAGILMYEAARQQQTKR